jgi:hypothetical protein
MVPSAPIASEDCCEKLVANRHFSVGVVALVFTVLRPVCATSCWNIGQIVVANCARATARNVTPTIAIAAPLTKNDRAQLRLS